MASCARCEGNNLTASHEPNLLSLGKTNERLFHATCERVHVLLLNMKIGHLENTPPILSLLVKGMAVRARVVIMGGAFCG